jgi:hypothetical protein
MQIFYGFPELSVIMGKVFNEMSEKIMERLFGFRIFLSAMRAESFFNLMSAVQARFIFSNFSVAHGYNYGFQQI